MTYPIYAANDVGELGFFKATIAKAKRFITGHL